MDEVLCADRRTEEQNKKDKDKGARAERKKYARDAAIGGTFGRILRISTAVVAAVGKKKPDTDTDGTDAARTEGVKVGR